jgi:hypothetical protein
MDAGSIFLILALILLVGIFVARPFLRPQLASVLRKEDEGAEHQRSSLLADRDRLLTALQELDFDHRLGKIPAEDYPEMRANMLSSAALVMRKLDEIQGVAAQPESPEDRIEQVIAARRADAAVVKAGNGASAAVAAAVKAPARANDELENLIASRKRDRQEKSAGFCPKCGKPAQKSDRFCSRCGTTL